ncbi:MAG: hypothetical protein KGI54_14555 [Pseudomonadota bacterium]|nr:hypothetical protein [Pseudomonadota bacterium]
MVKFPKDCRRPAWGNTADRKFYLKSGWLTPYALACGYVEVRDLPNNVEVWLFHDGACFHVQGRSDTHGRFIWESFNSLPAARQFFATFKP